MGTDDTGGLFKWTMDALFNRGVSPSLKYSEGVHEEPFAARPRASSFSDVDIYSKYELLPDEEEPELLRPVSMGNVPDEKQDTNTFHARRNWNGESEYGREGPSIRREPDVDNPIISRLFQVDENNNAEPDLPQTRRNGDRQKGFLPGKFPSPTKTYRGNSEATDAWIPSVPVRSEPKVAKIVDYTPEYVKLLDRLSLHNKKLNELRSDVQTKQKLGMEKETELKQKYLEIRQELIRELKQSKMMYDNYCKLYYKYKDVKRRLASLPSHSEPARPTAMDSHQSMLHKIRSLENQVVDLSIENGRIKKQAEEEVLSLQLQRQELENKFEVERMVYEQRLKDLQDKLQATDHPANHPQPPHQHSVLHTASSPISSASFLPPHTQDTSDSTASPYKEYNNTIDTQFLRNLVK